MSRARLGELDRASPTGIRLVPNEALALEDIPRIDFGMWDHENDWGTLGDLAAAFDGYRLVEDSDFWALNRLLRAVIGSDFQLPMRFENLDWLRTLLFLEFRTLRNANNPYDWDVTFNPSYLNWLMASIRAAITDRDERPGVANDLR